MSMRNRVMSSLMPPTGTRSPGWRPDHCPLDPAVLEIGEHGDVAGVEDPQPLPGQERAADVPDEHARTAGPGAFEEPEHALGQRPGVPDVTGQHDLGVRAVAIEHVTDDLRGRHA